MSALPLGQIVADHEIVPSDVALVWCDIQGSETQLILSAPDLWSAGVPLYAEVFPDGLELHGGIGDFIDAAQSSVSSYISRDALIDGEPPRPMSTFSRWVDSIYLEAYSDVLLIA